MKKIELVVYDGGFSAWRRSDRKTLSALKKRTGERFTLTAYNNLGLRIQKLTHAYMEGAAQSIRSSVEQIKYEASHYYRNADNGEFSHGVEKKRLARTTKGETYYPVWERGSYSYMENSVERLRLLLMNVERYVTEKGGMNILGWQFWKLQDQDNFKKSYIAAMQNFDCAISSKRIPSNFKGVQLHHALKEGVGTYGRLSGQIPKFLNSVANLFVVDADTHYQAHGKDGGWVPKPWRTRIGDYHFEEAEATLNMDERLSKFLNNPKPDEARSIKEYVDAKYPRRKLSQIWQLFFNRCILDDYFLMSERDMDGEK